jgi:hypothetical protein
MFILIIHGLQDGHFARLRRHQQVAASAPARCSPLLVLLQTTAHTHQYETPAP